MSGLELNRKLQEIHKKSYVWALRCCANDPANAEDVLQTVYLKILDGKAKYDGKAVFKTWLFAVIRKTAADMNRRKYLRRLKLLDYRESVASEIPGNHHFVSEDMDAFRQALAKLPRRQQQILELVFYHDLTVEQAGKVMKVSTGSARTHYHRAKKRIRDLMMKFEAFEESRHD